MALHIATTAKVLSLWPRGYSVSNSYPESTDKDTFELRQTERAVALIENYSASGTPISVEDIAKYCGLSTRQLERRFMDVLSVNPRDLIEQRRLIHAKEALINSHNPATTIAEKMGFSSIHAFSRWFTRLTGTSPSKYRNDTIDKF